MVESFLHDVGYTLCFVRHTTPILRSRALTQVVFRLTLYRLHQSRPSVWWRVQDAGLGMPAKVGVRRIDKCPGIGPGSRRVCKRRG